MTVVAVAIAVMTAVIVLTGGVVADSDGPDTLSFFGVSVQTTSAQIFLTGAICTWALLASAWLLSAGLRRSRERGEQLAVMRGRPGCDRPPGALDDAPAITGTVDGADDRPGTSSGRDPVWAQQDPAEQEAHGE